MSTPADNIGTSAAEPAGSTLPDLGAEDSWITSFHIDDPVTTEAAPLPTDASADATQGATADEGTAKPAEIAAEAPLKPIEPAPAAVDGQPPPPPVDAAPAEPPLATPTVADPELTPQEATLVESLPEADRAKATTSFKRAYFMDHYLNPDKPATEIRDHLKDRSPLRFAELETSIIQDRLAAPDKFCSDLYQRAPEDYAKLASEVYKGAPQYFTKEITGRDGLTPEEVKSRLDFYDRNKDRIGDDEVNAELDEETLAEIETYFPDQAPLIKKQLEAAKTAVAENDALKKQLSEKGKDDQPKTEDAAAQQQEVQQREVNELWDLGRDTVFNHIVSMATDPVKGVGITATPEERQQAPLVARLKDIKASVLFNGLDVDGKPLLPDFHSGLIKWGEGRKEFVDKILHMDKFTQAREKNNVLEVAGEVNPYAATYYNERLKNPIFAELDQLIQLAQRVGTTPPRFDKQIPGQLPSKGGGSTQGAGSDDWLIQDAVARAG